MEITRIIEEYLDGSLSASEKAWVEKKAATDQEFKELITFYDEINESIRDRQFNDFHQLLQKVEASCLKDDETKPHSPSAHPYRNIFLKIAALLILIVCAGIVIKLAIFNHHHHRLYDKYYERFEPDAITRSAESERTALNSAIIAYENQQYQDAFDSFNIIATNNPENYLAWFYKGLTALELDRAGEAIASFNSIPVDWDSILQEHRNWYLGLAYLKNGQERDAVLIFEDIGRLNGYYAEKAQELLGKIHR